MSVSLREVSRALSVMALLLVPGPAWAQCAMCRRALDSPEGRQMIEALQVGILVLLVAPFALFVSIAVIAVRAQRERLEDRNSPDA